MGSALGFLKGKRKCLTIKSCNLKHINIKSIIPVLLTYLIGCVEIHNTHKKKKKLSLNKDISSINEGTDVILFVIDYYISILYSEIRHVNVYYFDYQTKNIF